MRCFSLLVLLVPLLAPAAGAEPRTKSAFEPGPVKPLPLKGATSGHSCAAFGPGFVKVEGSDTCVKLGGAIQIDAGTSVGGRR